MGVLLIVLNFTIRIEPIGQRITVLFRNFSLMNTTPAGWQGLLKAELLLFNRNRSAWRGCLMTKKTRPKFPSVEEVRQLPLQANIQVPAEWEDRNGHVNVQYYLTLYEIGGWKVLEDSGFDDPWFTRQGVSMFDLEHHLHFLDEIRVGVRVSTYNRILGMSEKCFHGMYFIVNDQHDRLAGVLEYITAHVDMKTRRTSPLLPELARGVGSIFDEHEKLEWPAPVCGAMSP
jgi:acyl-CoA thioester hydrolase